MRGLLEEVSMKLPRIASGLYQALFAPICVIGLIHVINGFSALVAPRAALVTGLYGLSLTGSTPWQVVISLIVVGAIAIAGRLMALRTSSDRLLRTSMVVPQQVVLLVQAIGICFAIWKGAYPDGYVPATRLSASRWFIFSDQAPLLVLCLSHAVDMVFANRIMMTQRQYEVDIEDCYRKVTLLTCRLELRETQQQWLEFSRDLNPKSNR
jgi:hypothetical protein